MAIATDSTSSFDPAAQPALVQPTGFLNQQVRAHLSSASNGTNTLPEIFGLVFGGEHRLAGLLDAVSFARWPEDEEPIDPISAGNRKHLLICSNLGARGIACLHYFTAIKPNSWNIQELPDTVPDKIRSNMANSVLIDASARLAEKSSFPAGYTTALAYLYNLYWLATIENHPQAVMEVNHLMGGSLGKWGVELTDLSVSRQIGGTTYSAMAIDPSSEKNSGLVEFADSLNPTILTMSGAKVLWPTVESSDSGLAAAS